MLVRTIAMVGNGSSNAKPKIEDFGLPVNFDVREFERIQAEREKRIGRIGLITIILTGLIASIQCGFDLLGTILIFPFVCFGTAIPIGLIFSTAVPFLQDLFTGEGQLKRGVERYLAAKADWEYHCLTTGEGFWRKLRGTDLENAAIRLFREKGWSASATATTGDGGIDIVLRSGREEYWCQCKGYAKPVSVSAVREIAGVCSQSSASAMLIVVNGLTQPARIEAEKYSVLVWDSRELAKFARS